MTLPSRLPCKKFQRSLLAASPSNVALIAAIVFGVHGAGAHAQAVSQPAAPATAGQLDPEIVVTATRRAESVYKVPYNISAISAAQIVNSGATGLADITRLAPGISFLDQGGRVAWRQQQHYPARTECQFGDQQPG